MTDHYEELLSGIDILKNVIKKYRKENNPKIEIELRLGRIDDTKFTTGINSNDFFYKIIRILDTGKNCWNKVEEINSVELISDNIKQISKNDIITYQYKKNIKNYNFYYENTPCDIRLSINSEEELDLKKIKKKNILFDDNCVKRVKNRKKYYYKEFVLDITKVIQTINTLDKIYYEIELEIIDLKSSSSDIYIAHSAFLLLRDIINMIEKIPSDAELLYLELEKVKI